jgi:hypothetical protein
MRAFTTSYPWGICARAHVSCDACAPIGSMAVWRRSSEASARASAHGYTCPAMLSAPRQGNPYRGSVLSAGYTHGRKHGCVRARRNGCIYARMHAGFHPQKREYVHISTNVCIYARLHSCRHECMHLYKQESLHTGTNGCIHRSANVYIFMRDYVHISMRACTHAYMRACRPCTGHARSTKVHWPFLVLSVRFVLDSEEPLDLVGDENFPGSVQGYRFLLSRDHCRRRVKVSNRTDELDYAFSGLRSPNPSEFDR